MHEASPTDKILSLRIIFDVREEKKTVLGVLVYCSREKLKRVKHESLSVINKVLLSKISVQ